jgi:predicted ribosomally synthesized peptide with SipW-like signal peptide
MKRRLLITAVAVLALSLAAYGTLAYLTGSATAQNVITSGSVEIELLDQTASNAKISFPTEGLKVMPGTTVSKEVSVKNLSSECWVRVKLVKTIKLENQEALQSEWDPVTLNLNKGDGANQWTDAGGGYYYYNSPLAVGAETSKLFTTATFDKGMGNEFQNASLAIQVYAEAVQTANNDIPADGDVTKVQGWPETPADR